MLQHIAGRGCISAMVLVALCLAWAPSASAQRTDRASMKDKARDGVILDESPNPWPPLTADQQIEIVKKLQKASVASLEKIQRPMPGVETKFFLFYTDLPTREANHWLLLLDKMYVRLSELFAVKPGVNIWRGKAVIFVFSRREDYYKYESEIEHANATGTAGMCMQVSDGTVRVAFYRETNELDFAHVLVHESVHGFVHRYRGPARVPSWANEGLAEAIATELVPQRGRPAAVRDAAQRGLRDHQGDMGDFFTTDHIEGWQYPVSEELTTFMILQNKKNYVAFINGIKDGQEWPQSLNENYKAPLSRLVPYFGQWLGVRGVTAQGPA